MFAYPKIRLVLPYCIHIPEESYEITHKGYSCLINVVYLPNTSPSPTGLHISGVEIIHDIFGRAGRTMLEIIFLEDKFVWGDIHSNNTGVSIDELIPKAMVFTNRFLAVCRDQNMIFTGEPSFHIIPINEKEILEFYLLYVDENFDNLTSSSSMKMIPGGIVTGAEAMKRTESIVQKIKTYLKDDVPITIDKLLLSSARNHLWRMEYNLVPIEANIAFEGVIISVLNKYLAFHEKTIDIPDNFFDIFVMLQKCYNEHRLIKNKKQNIFFDASKGWKNFTGIPVLMNWYNNCYKIRNEVIHNAIIDISKNDAENALNSAFNAIDFIYSIDET